MYYGALIAAVCFVLCVMCALVIGCVVGLVYAVREVVSCLSRMSDVLADHTTQFAYQLCVDDRDQVELARALDSDGDEQDRWGRSRPGAFRRAASYDDLVDSVMSGAEDNID